MMYRNAGQRYFARNLRNNMTDAERRLWRALRCDQLKGYRFRRQAAIGGFVVDFVCFDRHVVIELDGGQHNTADAKQYDAARSAWLASQGYRVLRFWNHDVFGNLDGVLSVIVRAIEAAEIAALTPPSLSPSPPGGGE